MVARKKTATRTKKPEPINSPVMMLKHLLDNYDFGPALNKRIDAIAVLPPADPFERIPPFLKQAIDASIKMSCRSPFKMQIGTDYDWFQIPHLDSHEVIVRFFKQGDNKGKVRFIWGCRSKWSEVDARKHWPNNVSAQSHKPRPHATELINFTRDVAAYRGAKW